MKSLIKNLQLISGFFLIGFLLTGCAFTRDYVSLSYVPQAGTAKVEGADKVSVQVEVADLRAITDKVGAKKNGYGMEMAPIVAQEDVKATLQKAIEAELENRGFHLAASNVIVVAELSKFYNDFKLGFLAGDAVAEVTMNVEVKSPDRSLIFSRLINGQGTNPNIQVASGSNAKVALDAALNDAIVKLFDEPKFTDALVKAAQPKNTVAQSQPPDQPAGD